MTYLDRWGYPYVLEEFRFHMTLAGSLPASRMETVTSFLRDRFAALELTSALIDRLTLLRQDDATSRFKVIQHWPLKAA